MIDKTFLLNSHRKRNYSESDIAEKAFGLTLRPQQKDVIKEFFKDGENGKPFYEECLLVCGKKSGKTFLGAVMNLILIYKWILMDNPHKTFGLLKGQKIYLLNTCAGRDQSIKVYLNQVKAVVNNSAFLKQFVENETQDEIHFRNNIAIKAQSSRSTSSLGYLCFSVTFDELAWFEDSNNKSSSKSCYDALLPNIKPFGGFGRSFILTSPSDTGSWFYGHYDFAGRSKIKLVIQKPTWEMNSNITRESLEEEFKRDYDKATMDWGGEFVESIGGAFSAEIIEASMKEDIRDVSVGDKRQRVIALDPALRKDAYALAMGYMDINFKVHIDYVTFWQGSRTNPVKISDVEEHILYLYKNYIVTKIVLDQRYSASTIQRLGEKGLPIFETFFDGGYKQKMYQVFKEKLNMDEVWLPRHEKVKNELVALKRKGSGAHIKYEAPTVGPVKSDDMADAIANCVYQLSILNEGDGMGTDDFAIDDTIYETKTEVVKELTEKEIEEMAKRKKAEEEEIKKIEKAGGFAID